MITFEEEIEKNGRLIYSNTGVSMLPLIRQGRDLIVIVKPRGRLGKYDVPLFRRDSGQYVLHRVVKVCGDGYVIRGDNCYSEERGIKDSQIVGVLSMVVRGGKEISVNSAGYKLYSRLWCFLYPLRRFAFKVKHRLRVLFRRVFKHK